MLCLGGGWGFPCKYPLHCPAQLGGCLVTICLQGSALLPWGPPCCRGLCPAAVGSTLLSWALPCWQSLSVMAGCLGNSRLRQQWECTSVGVEYLDNGIRPSPTKLHHPGFSCAHSETLNPKHFESPFCLSLWGWDLPSLITWLPASERFFFLFFKLNG